MRGSITTTRLLRWTLPAAERRATASMSATGASPSRAMIGGRWSPRRQRKCNVGRALHQRRDRSNLRRPSPPSISSSTTAVDDREREEIAEELADMLSELADAPMPPQVH